MPSLRVERRRDGSRQGSCIEAGRPGRNLPFVTRRVQTPTTTTTTQATAHGRRFRLRSPLLNKNGKANMEPKTAAGARIMIPDSSWCGLIARIAKYHSRYQSGARGRVQQGWIRGRCEMGWPINKAQRDDSGYHQAAKQGVSPGCIRPERNSVLLDQLLVLPPIRAGIHRNAFARVAPRCRC